MKIKAINYILHCPCGKTTIQTIKRRITEIEFKCPSCRQNQLLKVIGKVEHFNDMGESDENGKYSKLHYTLKPVIINNKWQYEDVIKSEMVNSKVDILAWKVKNAQWKIESKLDVAVIDEI
jgi:hypothetical protein